MLAHRDVKNQIELKLFSICIFPGIDRMSSENTPFYYLMELTIQINV